MSIQDTKGDDDLRGLYEHPMYEDWMANTKNGLVRETFKLAKTVERLQDELHQLQVDGCLRDIGGKVADCITIPDDTPEHVKKWLRDTGFPTTDHMRGAWMAIEAFGLLSPAGQQAGSGEAVATLLASDPYDETNNQGPWLSAKDWQRLRALHAGTKLYTHHSASGPQGLLGDLAAALYAAVQGGKLNEADVINQGGRKQELAELLDKAESFLSAAPQPVSSVPEGITAEMLEAIWKAGFDAESYDDREYCQELIILRNWAEDSTTAAPQPVASVPSRDDLLAALKSAHEKRNIKYRSRGDYLPLTHNDVVNAIMSLFAAPQPAGDGWRYKDDAPDCYKGDERTAWAEGYNAALVASGQRGSEGR